MLVLPPLPSPLAGEGRGGATAAKQRDMPISPPSSQPPRQGEGESPSFV